jgi:hypothetical protein
MATLPADVPVSPKFRRRELVGFIVVRNPRGLAAGVKARGPRRTEEDDAARQGARRAVRDKRRRLNYRYHSVKSEPGKGSVFTMRLLAGADT